MPVAKSIAEQLERASWIRRMFEEGARLKKERGEDSIFDFTLGNPEVEPPALTLATLRRVVEKGLPHSHGYMPNPGFPEVRAAIANKLRREVGLPFAAEHVCMTSGAAAACNVILKSILDPGDEVVLFDEPSITPIRKKRRASVRIAAECVRDGRASGMFTAGHTGAAMVVAKMIMGVVEGIDRLDCRRHLRLGELIDLRRLQLRRLKVPSAQGHRAVGLVASVNRLPRGGGCGASGLHFFRFLGFAIAFLLTLGHVDLPGNNWAQIGPVK